MKEKDTMRKWMILLVILVLLGYLVSPYSPVASLAPQNQKGSMERQEKVGTKENQDDTQDQDKKLIEVTKEQVYKGDLLLINKEYPLVAGNEVQDLIQLAKHTKFVNRIALLDRSISLSQDVAEQFLAMAVDADREGVSHFMVSSGYRDEQEQDELYEQKGSEYALPAGYSEHNLGLALDVGSTQGSIGQSKEGKWLRKNAWRYGFILRYPEDKEDITGIKYEPWHFRYIGLPHSAIMQERDLVLEEYLDLLREQKSLSMTIDGQHYKVHYYPVGNSRKIAVPATGSYTLSGNNVDGVIVTERYE